MKAYSITQESRELKAIDINMHSDTVYSFFNSILTDELLILDKHVIYSDANAISEGKKPFFIAEQLIVGDALILGRDTLEDVDATIPHDELESLISYDITPFYIDTLKVLKNSDINIYKVFEVTREEEDIQLNTEWVLDVFNIADDKTKEYFLVELQKAVDAKKDIFEYMQKMAILALNAMAQQSS
ncbi:MAG: hypothetical protein U9N33_10330 [Campylobacterota bacterium]|nr:hypothetical protein [Campylobacterota bacterium]